MEWVRTQKVLDLCGINRVNPCGRSWVGRWNLGSGVPGRVAEKTASKWLRIADLHWGGAIQTYGPWSVIRTQKVLDLRGTNHTNPCWRTWVGRWDLGSSVPSRVVANTSSKWSRAVDQLKG
jgi:hypothetical protein